MKCKLCGSFIPENSMNCPGCNHFVQDLKNNRLLEDNNQMNQGTVQYQNPSQMNQGTVQYQIQKITVG